MAQIVVFFPRPSSVDWRCCCVTWPESCDTSWNRTRRRGHVFISVPDYGKFIIIWTFWRKNHQTTTWVYVDGTFTVLQESEVEYVIQHLNSMDENIALPVEPEEIHLSAFFGDVCLSEEDGSTKVKMITSSSSPSKRGWRLPKGRSCVLRWLKSPILDLRSCCSVGRRCRMEGRHFSASWSRWFVSNLAVAWYMPRRQSGRCAAVSSQALM